MDLIFPIVTTLLLAIQCIVCLVLCSLSLSGAQGESDMRAFSAFIAFAAIDSATIYYIWTTQVANSPAIGLIIFVVLLAVMGVMYRALTRG